MTFERRNDDLIPTASSVAPLALTCPRVWVFFVQRSLEPHGLAALGPYYVAELAVIALLAAWIYFSGRPSERAARAPIRAALPFCLVSPVCAFGLDALGGVLVPLMGAAAGACLICCYVSCAQMYARMPLEKSLVAIMTSFAVATLVCFPLSLLPLEVACVMVAALPPLCMAMCARGMGDDPAPSEVQAGSRAGRVAGFVPYALAFFAFGLIVGNYRLSARLEGGDAMIEAVSTIANTCLPFLLLALLNRLKGSISLSFICQIALILIMTSLIMIASGLGGALGTAAVVAADVVRRAVTILLFSTLVIVIGRLPQHPAFVFALGWSVYPSSTLLGLVASHLMDANGTSLDSYLIFVMYGLVILTLVLIRLAARIDAESARIFGDDASPANPEGSQGVAPSQDSAYEVLDRACRDLCARHALTSRETDVVEMINRGWTRSYIAAQLGLSENTVRSYAREAYVKLDIHSRGELLELVRSNVS